MLRRIISCNSYSRLLTVIRPLSNLTGSNIQSKTNEPLSIKKQNISLQSSFKRYQSNSATSEPKNETINDHILTSSFKCAVDNPVI